VDGGVVPDHSMKMLSQHFNCALGKLRRRDLRAHDQEGGLHFREQVGHIGAGQYRCRINYDPGKPPVRPRQEILDAVARKQMRGVLGDCRNQRGMQGQILDKVVCDADAAQSYALYLPSNYSPDRAWSVIFAFDPLARGRAPLVKYQAAAEKYGYIVAGSNNSRNGPWNVSLAAAQAMSADVGTRFSIDPKRMYTAGLSGGARVAMALAISMNQFAGVIASSAGFSREVGGST